MIGSKCFTYCRKLFILCRAMDIISICGHNDDYMDPATFMFVMHQFFGVLLLPPVAFTLDEMFFSICQCFCLHFPQFLHYFADDSPPDADSPLRRGEKRDKCKNLVFQILLCGQALHHLLCYVSYCKASCLPMTMHDAFSSMHSRV